MQNAELEVVVPRAKPKNAELEAVVQRVKSKAGPFAALPIDDRIELIRALRDGLREQAETMVRLGCQAKGIDPTSPRSSEEWASGPLLVIRNLRLLEETLVNIKNTGSPVLDPRWLRERKNGRLAVQVFPTTAYDKTLLAGHVGEVWLEAGVTRSNVKQHQAGFYRAGGQHSGRLCVVLGAGNVASIGPNDCFYKMFVEGQVCILKMNPINAYLGPVFEKAFAAAVSAGYLVVTYGGAAEGAFLVNHPSVDEVHITGSDKTYDAMVWGTDGQAAERKRKGTPLIQKRITAELGNISPVVVVPGHWDDAALRFQAYSLAGTIAHNASFNCNSPKLILMSKNWPHREAFLEHLTKGLEIAGTRPAYYPGAEERWKNFIKDRRDVTKIGQPKPGELPFALIRGVDSSNVDEPVLREEPWCSVISESPIDISDPVEFLEHTAKLLNQRLWGTLCATYLIHDDSLRDPAIAEAFEKALEEINYGAIAVNTWSAAVYGVSSLPWGGHQSSTSADIQSGLGWVHNTFMFEELDKTILRAPIRQFPVPPWFPGHARMHDVTRRLVDFEMKPSWLKLPAIAFAAMRPR